MHPFRFRGPLSGLLLAAASGTTFAAGGHHAVDDANILEPGRCEAESWYTHSADSEKLVHAGVGCRVGPIEVGFAGDYARLQGGSETGWSLPLKWAAPVAETFRVGLSVTPFWLARAQPRYIGTTVSALATWSVSEQVDLHLNVGRDFYHVGDDDDRYGASAEWTVRPGWQLLAERFRERGTHFARAGVRWAGGENWSVDLSHAHRLQGPAASTWTLGATWAFER